MAHDEGVETLVARWQELQARGVDLSLEELCGTCPENLPEVRARVQALQVMHQFLFGSDVQAIPLSARPKMEQTLSVQPPPVDLTPDPQGTNEASTPPSDPSPASTGDRRTGDGRLPLAAGTNSTRTRPAARARVIPELQSPPNPSARKDLPSPLLESQQTPPAPIQGDNTERGDPPAFVLTKRRPGKGDFAVPGCEILEELGRGGMGVVYKARQIALNRTIALKMIRASGQATPGELLRFKAEAQALAALQHPNIIQVFEIGEYQGNPYFTMEFAVGGSLDQLLQHQPQLPRGAAALVETLARAIQAAYECGIVHRDLKPANILLSVKAAESTTGKEQKTTGKGQVGSSRTAGVSSAILSAISAVYAVKISDFGLAKRLENDSGVTATEAVIGTPSYMAPEQARGRTKAAGPAADIYALGAILYDLLTGRPPFKGASLLETLEQVRSTEPVPPSRLQPKLPRDLETICLKCLRKEEKARYASALELAEDLRRFLTGEPIKARPVGVVERAVKWIRRKPVTAALIAMIVLTAVGLVGGALLYGLYEHQQRAQLETDLRRFQAAFSDSQAAFAAAQAAYDHQQWDEARVQASRAVARAETEETLRGLHAQAQKLLHQATVRSEERDRGMRLRQLHDEGLFHSTPVTALDRTGNARKVRATGRAAIELFGLKSHWHPDHFLSESGYSADEKRELTGRFYELLMVMAEATATVLPGEDALTQTQQAQVWRKHAARLRQLTAVAAPFDHFLSGLAAYEKKNLSKATQSFDQALGLDPRHFWARLLLGLCYLEADRPTEACFSFATCVGQKPDFVWPYLLRGFAQGELGARALVDRQLRPEQGRVEAEQHFQAAEADFRKATQLERTEDADFVLHNNRGILRLRQKQLTEAVEELTAAIKLRPRSCQCHVNLAEAHLQLKQWAQARARLDQALALNDQLASAYRSRARLYQQPQLRDLPAALKNLERASACDNTLNALDVAGDHKERGLILLALKKPTDALAAFDAALKVRPDQVIAHRLRAETLMKLQRHRDALVSWDIYLQAIGRSLGDQLAVGEPVANSYRARGVALVRLGQPLSALEDFNRSLDLEKDGPTFAFRGWIYVVADAHTLALPDFDKALAMDPKNGDAYAGRGWCRVQFNDLDAGLQDAEKALELGPREPRQFYNVARILAQAARQTALLPTTPLNLRQMKECQERAVLLLHKALILTPAAQRAAFWREQIARDSVFHSLRQLDSFRQLQVNP